jgi:hypothetical protein
MQTVEFTDGGVNVEARLIAPDLGLDPAEVLSAMRAGDLTAVCERGLEQDAGHYRLTFFYAGKRLRLTVDAQGQVLQRATARLRRRPRVRPAGAG